MGSHFSSEHFGIYECLLRKGVTPNNICFSLPKNISKGISQNKTGKKKPLKNNIKSLERRPRHIVLDQSCRYHFVETQGIQKLTNLGSKEHLERQEEDEGSMRYYKSQRERTSRIKTLLKL